MRGLLALLVIAVAPGVHHTAAGVATAHRALLRHADLGAAWVAGTTPKKVAPLACKTVTQPRGVVEVGSAVSPTYRESASGPFVSQSTYVYDSAAGAVRYYQQVARPGALDCLVRSVASGGAAQGVAFTISKQQSLPAPNVGVTAAAYRVVGRATVQAQKVTVYVDVVLLQHGATISEVSFASFLAPFAPSDELRVARAAARRL
jgi:hypothetical protein